MGVWDILKLNTHFGVLYLLFSTTLGFPSELIFPQKTIYLYQITQITK
jgi:hypothetical protein